MALKPKERTAAKIICEQIEMRARTTWNAIDDNHSPEVRDNIWQLQQDVRRLHGAAFEDDPALRKRFTSALNEASIDPDHKIKMHREPFVTVNGTFDLAILARRMTW